MLVLIVGDLHLPLRAAALPLKFRKLLVPGKIQQVVCTGNVCDRETWDYLRTIAPDVKGVKGDFDESPHLPQTLILQHGPLRLGVVHGHQILPPGDRDLLHSVACQMDVDVLLTGSTHRFENWEFEGRFYVNPGSATGAWSSHWPLFADDESGEVESEAETAAEEKEEQKDDGKATDEAAEGDKPSASQADAAAKPAAAEQTTASSAASASKPKTKKKKPRKPAAPPTPSFVLLDIQGPNVVSYVYKLVDGEVKVEKSEYKKDMEASAEAETGVAAGGVGAAAVMAGPAGGGPGW